MKLRNISNLTWKKWEGGKCPVDSHMMIIVKYREGTIEEEDVMYAGSFNWEHEGHEWDIVEYHVINSNFIGGQ